MVKMVEVSGADKNGRYEKIVLNSLCVMFNVKVFAMQNTTHYKDPSDTHMDQKSVGVSTTCTWIFSVLTGLEQRHAWEHHC